jgi:hypothetical protein
VTPRRPRGIAEFFAPEFGAAVVAWGCGLGAFVLYAVTASPWVGSHDTAEFQALARTGGIAHAGYPTVTLLLRAFQALPFGTWPYRANLLSCVSGAVACGCVAWLAARLTRRVVAGVAAATALALTLTLWNESTNAGVHAFTLALDALLLVAVLRYVARASAAVALAIGMLFGLGLTSHLTALSMSFVLIVALVHAARSGTLRASHVAAAAGGLVLGLSPFAYLFAMDTASQPMNYIADTLDPSLHPFAVAAPDAGQRLERFVWLMTARQYLADPSLYEIGTLLRRFLYVGVDFGFNELAGGTWLLALWGLVVLARRGGAVGGLLFAWLAGAVVFVAVGAIEGMARIFFLPGLFVLAAALGVAVGALARSRVPWAWFALAFIAGTPFLRLGMREMPAAVPDSAFLRSVWQLWPERWNPFVHDRGWEDYGRGVFAAVAPRAMLLTCWEEATTLRYFENADPPRDDVDVVYACGHAPRVRRFLEAAEAEGRPVYTTYEPAAELLGGGSAGVVWRHARGSLWRIRGSDPRP